jgi:hypothetical protein
MGAHMRDRKCPCGVILFVLKPNPRGLECVISPTNHITGNWTNSKNEPFQVSLEGWGARMLNRKLRNIRPSGAFSSEVTSSYVMWPEGFPWKGGVRPCATGSCTISDQTSPVLRNQDSEDMDVFFPDHSTFHLGDVYLDVTKDGVTLKNGKRTVYFPVIRWISLRYVLDDIYEAVHFLEYNRCALLLKHLGGRESILVCRILVQWQRTRRNNNRFWTIPEVEGRKSSITNSLTGPEYSSTLWIYT